MLESSRCPHVQVRYLGVNATGQTNVLDDFASTGICTEKLSTWSCTAPLAHLQDLATLSLPQSGEACEGSCSYAQSRTATSAEVRLSRDRGALCYLSGSGADVCLI